MGGGRPREGGGRVERGAGAWRGSQGAKGQAGLNFTLGMLWGSWGARLAWPLRAGRPPCSLLITARGLPQTSLIRAPSCAHPLPHLGMHPGWACLAARCWGCTPGACRDGVLAPRSDTPLLPSSSQAPPPPMSHHGQVRVHLDQEEQQQQQQHRPCCQQQHHHEAATMRF